jgi:MFS family permease
MDHALHEPLTQAKPTKIWNITFISVFLTNMAISLGQMMSNSLLSAYADSLGAPASQIGVLMSMFAISALLLKVVTAPAADTFNRKYIVIGAMVFYASAFLGYSFSRTMPLLMFFRVLQGIGMTFGAVSCMTMAAEALPREQYNAGMGYYALAQTVSQAIGPTIGLWIAQYAGYPVTFLASACMMGVATIAAFNIRVKFKRTKKFRITLNNVVAKEAILPAVVQLFLSMGICVVNSFIVVFAAKQGVTDNIGLYFTVSALTMIFTRPFVGKLMDKYGLVKIFIPAIFCDVVAFFIISFARTLPVFLIASFIAGFGFGACSPAVQALAMKSVPNERRGAGSSTNFLGSDIGLLIGPTTAGFLAEHFGYVSMWRVMAIPLVVAIALVAVFRGRITEIEENFMAGAESAKAG